MEIAGVSDLFSLEVVVTLSAAAASSIAPVERTVALLVCAKEGLVCIRAAFGPASWKQWKARLR